MFEDDYDDEYYCTCEYNEPGDCPCTDEDDPDCTACSTCWEQNTHNCRFDGCMEDPNIHIAIFGCYPSGWADGYYD